VSADTPALGEPWLILTRTQPHTFSLHTRLRKDAPTLYLRHGVGKHRPSPPHYSSGQRPQASRINLAFCHLLPHRGRVTLTLLGPSLEAGKSSRQLHHLPQNDSIPQGDTHSSCHLLQGCWPLPTTPFTPSHGDLWWPRRHRGAWDLSPSQATASIPYFRGYLPCEAFPDLSPACP
jgi:hypothetical protein